MLLDLDSVKIMERLTPFREAEAGQVDRIILHSGELKLTN